ncbi:hypothetical protein [Micromonospora sp. LOL_023]|uniref:hypothetical protein n=1 Tax=Micromonospora sp. LOL_023 TaxID=3345418 RepID=UPI003A868B06
MRFNPLEEAGIPLEKQLRSWSELNVEPYEPHGVDPYTRCRVIVMNGIEVEAITFSHQMNRHVDDIDLRQKLAYLRYIEQQQQKAINWMIPGQESVLEVVLGYEQVATDITAWVARNEPDPYLRQNYKFGLLEDFDHLYRYSNLYELTQGKKAQAIVDYLTEVMPGRPTSHHHRHPEDNIRKHYDKHTVDPLSRMHAITITAAEQQTMNYYMNVGPEFVEPIARGLYLEIAMVEEEHVTQYESMLDPAESWLEQLVHHEYNECYMYWSFAQDEDDRRIKQVWELNLAMEIEQLKVAADLLRRYDGREPEQILPAEMPQPTKFQPNKDFIREVIAQQVDITTFGTGFVAEWPARYIKHMATVNAGGAPSEQVIDENAQRNGREYRNITDGPYPAEQYAREKVREEVVR